MPTSNPTHDTNPAPAPEKTPSRFTRLYNKGMKLWYYCSEGVWRDRRNTFKVNAVKTANLTIRSFLDSDLQSTACAMTYRTVLAIVPALAMILAIFRGFGFQDQLMTQLYSTFPAQKQTLALAFNFVDRYLNQATEGLFVGIGIIFLLYTLISLLSSVEDSFNSIWQIKQGRTMWRKVTDYLAIFIVLPVLMICAGGIQVVMSSTLQKINFIPLIGESVKLILDGVSLALTWLFFAGAYMLIPNAKVKFINALLAGVAVGTAFHVIQWLFVTGQMYVTKYNAIYGSFSFLPLMLIWMQLTWLITLIGALICYASQNIGRFNFYQDVDNISLYYKQKVTLAVMAVIAKRYVRNMSPVTSAQLATEYDLPERLVTNIVWRLKDVGLILFDSIEDRQSSNHPLIPAVDVNRLTVGEVLRRLGNYGSDDFIPEFSTNFDGVEKLASHISDAEITMADNYGITSLNLTTSSGKDETKS